MIKFYDFYVCQYTKNILNISNFHNNLLKINLNESNIFYSIINKIIIAIFHLNHFFIIYVIKINNLLSLIVILI